MATWALGVAERIVVSITGVLLAGVGAAAVLTGNLALLAVFCVAALAWLPFIAPLVIGLVATDRTATERWVEVGRRRVVYVAVPQPVPGPPEDQTALHPPPEVDALS